MAIDTAPRSRRAILSAAAGGLAGLVSGALGRPGITNAAAGEAMRLGQANDSGTSQTTLSNAGLGAAFTLKSTNTAAGATGIFGWTSSTGMGATRGVYGKADGPNSYGVFGRQSGAAGSGAAVYAEGNNNDGLVGISTNPDRYGVKGLAPGTGVYGGATSLTGQTAGVIGAAGGEAGSSGVLGVGSGAADGVRGSSDHNTAVYGSSVDGYGVRGNTPSGIGVSGEVGDGTGVSGSCVEGVGVLASALGGGDGVHCSAFDGYGIFAESMDSYSGFFDGDVHVNGTLSKSLGMFRIDHPLDPAGKYLNHSFVESPDMKNIYDGVATLNEQGEATISLPGYFEALNRDLRYQLTALGAFSPLYVKSKVAKGRFRIAGGTAGEEVCWQVTGIRKDPYAEAHRIVVEEAKPSAERGLYLHPDLYGQPSENGLVWSHRKSRPPVGGVDGRA
jgi:hypothetical protein